MSDYIDVNDAAPVPGALCYVEHQFAWFTTQNLSRQWGEDWAHNPYELYASKPNAFNPDSDGRWCRCRDPKGSNFRRWDEVGTCLNPQGDHTPDPPSEPWELYRVQYYPGYLERPSDHPEGVPDSGCSIRDLNRRKRPWLSTEWPKYHHRRLDPRPLAGAFPTMSRKVEIYAGASFRAFHRLLMQAGGDVLVCLGQMEARFDELRLEGTRPEAPGEPALLDPDDVDDS